MEDNALLGSNSSNIFLITSIVLLVLFLFGLIVLYVNLKKQNRVLKKKWERAQGDLDWYKSHKKKYSKAQKQSNDDILSEKMEEKISPTVELSISDPESENYNNDDETFAEKETLILENIFYMSFPDKEKTFYAPEASSIPKADTFYKIEEENLFLYDNISIEQMNTAMNFVENHIKRVCVIQNAREPIHSKVSMISPGKVIRNGNDYIVTDKIRVFYA